MYLGGIFRIQQVSQHSWANRVLHDLFLCELLCFTISHISKILQIYRWHIPGNKSKLEEICLDVFK